MADENKDQQDKTNQNTTLFNMCQVSLDSIFKQMHDKAVEQSKSIAKVQNSIFDENGKFHGAGSHMIVATSFKELEIKKSEAFSALTAYVNWFSGPDIAKSMTEDKLIALEDEAAQTTESIDIRDIYRSVISEADEVADGTEAADADKATGTEAGKLDGNKDKKDEKPAEEKAKGYYITYKLEIEGQKESPLSDAFKTFGKGLLKGLGIQTFSWRSGSKGKEYTIGGLLDKLDQVFGKIDPNELRSRFTKNIKTKYPQTAESDVHYYDQKTILHHLKGKLEPKDIQKIKTADYSLCYRVPANDKSKKLINTTVVADMLTQSIKGIFKKFKNAVKKDDVILVNDYKETNKDQKKVDKKLEPAEESIKKLMSSLDFIFEDASIFSSALAEAESEQQKKFRPMLQELASEKAILDALENDSSYTDADVAKESGTQKLTTKADLLKKLRNGEGGIRSFSGNFMEKLVTRLQTLKDNIISQNTIKKEHTDVDFYIVPMKNLKMDNTEDDDEKAVAGTANK